MNRNIPPAVNALKLRPAIAGLIAIAAILGMIKSPRSQAQSLHTEQAFEATSIKPNHDCGGSGRGGGRPSPGRITAECAQLRDLILTAYGIYGNAGTPSPQAFRMQVLGGTAWIDTDRYDIAAKAEGNPPPARLYGPMLRTLLEDRFKLKVHRETKQAPVYLLTVAKGGAHLRPAKEESCVTTDIDHPLPQAAPGQPLPRACGSEVTRAEGTFEMFGATMASLSTQLAMRLDRDVIDKTGIAGMYDIHLEVSRTDLRLRALAGAEVDPLAPALETDSSGPSIFTALQQQLGLKLESARGPVEVLVIDHIEKPAAN